MAFGASAVFGEAVDEVVLLALDGDAEGRLDTVIGPLRREDRLLLLDSGADLDTSRPQPNRLRSDMIAERLAAWSAPAQVVCLSLADPAGSPLTTTDLDVRVIERGGVGRDAALTEARRRGLDATVLTDGLVGEPSSVGRALARVGLAVQAGLGGLVHPACALASGRVKGGARRHEAVVAAAEEALGSAGAIVVECWSPGPRAPDLFAVLVAAPPGEAASESA
jgi:hypothetical protein